MPYPRQPNRNLRKLGLSIALGLAIAAFISGYWSFSMSDTANPMRWWVGWLQDVGTEMLGAAVTILLVELVIYQKRDEADRLDRERMRRRDQFADRLKFTTRLEMRQKIIDRMKQQNLLARAWLYEVHLEGVDLSQAEMPEADLFEAQLFTANLSHANLQNAVLRRANLQAADLQDANLRETDLQDANLRGADLTGADLQDANLQGAKFNSQTILPDGSQWHPDQDLDCFVDPESPQFWRSPDLIPLSVMASSLVDSLKL
jgi:hypothetical protein